MHSRFRLNSLFSFFSFFGTLGTDVFLFSFHRGGRVKRFYATILLSVCLGLFSCDIFSPEEPADDQNTDTEQQETIDENESTQGALDGPTNFRVISQTDTSAVLAWDSVSTATSYTLFIEGSAENLDHDWSQTATANRCTLTGLKSNVSYTVKIWALRDSSESEEMALVEFVYWLHGSPESVRATPAENGTTTLSWDKKTGEEITGYRIYVMDHNGVKEDSLDVDTTATSATVSGLASNRAYKISVATLAENGVGPVDSTAQVDTSSSKYNTFRLPYAYVSTYQTPPQTGGGDLLGVKGGIYMMGNIWEDTVDNAMTDHLFAGAIPIHEVIVSSFYLDPYETTTREYVEFLNDNHPLEFLESWLLLNGDTLGNLGYMNTASYSVAGDSFAVESGMENHPMVGLHWHGAAAYCNWLSQEEGLEPCYSATWECDFTKNGYRLPTEAEFEYASSGAFTGVKQRFPWGYEFSSSAGAVGPEGDLEPVGSYSDYHGFYDLAGSVMEFVNDWSDTSMVSYAVGTTPYYIECRSKGVVIDPRGPEYKGFKHLMRGGGYHAGKKESMCIYRYIDHCNTSNDYGFRVARSAL